MGNCCGRNSEMEEPKVRFQVNKVEDPLSEAELEVQLQENVDREVQRFRDAVWRIEHPYTAMNLQRSLLFRRRAARLTAAEKEAWEGRCLPCQN